MTATVDTILSSREYVQSHLAAVKAGDFSKPLIGFDTETEGLGGPLVLASCSSPRGSAVLHPSRLPDAMASMPTPIVAHNLAYDMKVVHREGLSLPKGLLLDSMVAAHLLDENNPIGLKPLAKRYLDRDLKEWEDVGPDELEDYAIADAEACRDLMLYFWPRLAEQGLLDYFLRIEMPLVPIIAEMEMRGMRLDRERVSEALAQGERAVEFYYKEAYATLPPEFACCQREGCADGIYVAKVGKPRPCVQCEGTGLNPTILGSSSQLATLLHDHWGLPVVSTTDSGAPSTDRAALERHMKDGPFEVKDFLDALLNYRDHQKLVSTYYSAWAGQDRIHASLHQCGTVTGRWSSSDPNMQNVPPIGRGCFVPDPGYAFVSCDYSQLELYLLALRAGEDRILQAYREGEDLHKATALAAGLDPEKDRDKGKTFNFAIVYGLGINSLAYKLGCEYDEAAELYDKVFAYYPSLPKYRESVVEQMKRDGYVTSLLGRRRRLPDIHSSDWGLQKRAENQAVNFTIQGSAGDLIKCALIYTTVALPEVQPVMQIHDEILYQVPIDGAEEYARAIQECFESAVGNKAWPRAEATVMERWAKK